MLLRDTGSHDKCESGTGKSFVQRLEAAVRVKNGSSAFRCCVF